MEKTNVNMLKSLHQLGGELNVKKLRKPSPTLRERTVVDDG
jgi:hypothetical protein